MNVMVCLLPLSHMSCSQLMSANKSRVCPLSILISLAIESLNFYVYTLEVLVARPDHFNRKTLRHVPAAMRPIGLASLDAVVPICIWVTGS